MDGYAISKIGECNTNKKNNYENVQGLFNIGKNHHSCSLLNNSLEVRDLLIILFDLMKAFLRKLFNLYWHENNLGTHQEGQV